MQISRKISHRSIRTYSPPTQPITGNYLKGKNGVWHREVLEAECRVSLSVIGAQRLADIICRAEGWDSVVVAQAQWLAKHEILGGYLPQGSDYFILVPNAWTPAFIVFHELAHHAEFLSLEDKQVFYDQGLYYHSKLFYKHLKLLYAKYKQYLG